MHADDVGFEDFCLGAVPCGTVSVLFAILGQWSVFIEMCRLGLVFLGNWCLITLFRFLGHLGALCACSVVILGVARGLVVNLGTVDSGYGKVSLV